MRTPAKRIARLAPAALAAALLLGPACAADKVTVGTLRVTAAGPLYIAEDKGYFAKEGLDADLVESEQPQTLGQAVLSGDLDFGLVPLSAAFFNLTGQGQLHILAGNNDEAPGFQALGVVVSNEAYAGGLRSIGALAGHSFALPAIGTIPQYDLAVLAKKYRFDDRSLKILQLGSLPNVLSAVVGGSADSSITAVTSVKQPLQEQKLHLTWFRCPARSRNRRAFAAVGEKRYITRGQQEGWR